MLPNQLPGLNFGLGEAADMLRDMVMSFASEQIAPRAAEIDRSNEFPRDLWPQMGELGLLGITVDEDHGGDGRAWLAALAPLLPRVEPAPSSRMTATPAVKMTMVSPSVSKPR